MLVSGLLMVFDHCVGRSARLKSYVELLGLKNNLHIGIGLRKKKEKKEKIVTFTKLYTIGYVGLSAYARMRIRIISISVTIRKRSVHVAIGSYRTLVLFLRRYTHRVFRGGSRGTVWPVSHYVAWNAVGGGSKGGFAPPPSLRKILAKYAIVLWSFLVRKLYYKICLRWLCLWFMYVENHRIWTNTIIM